MQIWGSANIVCRQQDRDDKKREWNWDQNHSTSASAELKRRVRFARGQTTENTGTTTGQVLVRNPDEPNLGKKESTKYRSGTAKMMFMMWWSRPDIYNAVRGLARHMAQPQAKYYKAMQSCMKYILSTRHRLLAMSTSDSSSLLRPAYPASVMTTAMMRHYHHLSRLSELIAPDLFPP